MTPRGGCRSLLCRQEVFPSLADYRFNPPVGSTRLRTLLRFHCIFSVVRWMRREALHGARRNRPTCRTNGRGKAG